MLVHGTQYGSNAGGVHVVRDWAEIYYIVKYEKKPG